MGRWSGRSSITEMVIVPIPQWGIGSCQTVETTLETVQVETLSKGGKSSGNFLLVTNQKWLFPWIPEWIPEWIPLSAH